MLTAQEQTDLLGLGYQWAEHYALSVTDGGAWVARPAEDPQASITALSAAELREKLRLDFADRHPVSSDGYLRERMST